MYLLRIVNIDNLLRVALDEAVDQQPHKSASHDEEQYQAEYIRAAAILILHYDLLLVHEKGLAEPSVHLCAQLVHLRINYIN